MTLINQKESGDIIFNLKKTYYQETHRDKNEFWKGPVIEGYGWTETNRDEGQKKGGELGILYSN